jgi:hypothetical protein
MPLASMEEAFAFGPPFHRVYAISDRSPFTPVYPRLYRPEQQ